MPDDAMMAAAAFQVLSPYLTEFFRSASGECGKSVPGFIGNVWEGIKHRLARNPSGVEAIEDLLRAPDDPDFQAAFRVQLRKLLESDAEFASMISEFIQRPEIRDECHAFINGQGAIAQGSRSTAIGAVNFYSGSIFDVANVDPEERKLTAEETDYFLTISKSRNEGRISIEFLEGRSDRKNARYLEMVNTFINADLMRYDYPSAKFTRKGWELADELWKRRLIRAINNLQNPSEVGADSLVVGAHVGLHEDDNDKQDFERLTTLLEDEGLIEKVETLSDCSLCLTAAGATAARVSE